MSSLVTRRFFDSNPSRLASTSSAISLKSIQVEGLFGYFNYTFPIDSTRDLSRLFLLYGDNGSGKTTILQIVFHLLSTANDRGHRHFLARVPFHKIAVELSNGLLIKASRTPKKRLTGTYKLSVSHGTKSLHSFTFKTDSDLRHIDDSVADARLAAYLAELSKLSFNLYFVSDNRTLSTDLVPDNTPRLPTSAELASNPATASVLLRHYEELRSTQRETAIERSVDRLREWFQQQAIQGSKTGEANAHHFFVQVVRQITQSQGKSGPRSFDELKDLIRDLNSLQERSNQFAVSGLMMPVELSDLRRFVNKASLTQIDTLVTILKPYIDGIRARLDAFESLQRTISGLVRILNVLYKNKSVEFDINSGLRVVSRAGTELSPALLSSGEKQLMLIMCNVVMAQKRSSIFIIDEPELSLNIKWQRQLIDMLLEFTAASNVQFLIATHSIELLTRHQSNVVQLDDPRYRSRV